jgi:hypothetical protein
MMDQRGHTGVADQFTEQSYPGFIIGRCHEHNLDGVDQSQRS